MNYWWFLLLLVPFLIRLDLILKCPAIRLSEEEWKQRQYVGGDAYGGGQPTEYGLEAQKDWIGSMLILFLPFLLLAVLGATHQGR
jgi:hypothetical protein